MKKLIIFIVLLFILTGCTNLNETNIDTIIKNITESKIKITNEYRTGYKYYLPTNLNVIKSTKMNEIISSHNQKYYLYVDLVGYYYKKEITNENNPNAYYQKDFTYDNKKGFIEINVKNQKYLIEIMYNYAKIELIVDKSNINEAVANSLIILSSIEFNKNIIENMMGEDILNFSEEKFSIFDNNTKDSNFLEYIQEYDTYKSEIPDYDLIN